MYALNTRTCPVYAILYVFNIVRGALVNEIV